VTPLRSLLGLRKQPDAPLENSNFNFNMKGWQFLKLHQLTGAVAPGRVLALALIVLSALITLPANARETMGNVTPPPVVDENINGKSFSSSKIIVHARPEQVFRVLTDYANAPKVFPQMRQCKVISDHGTTKVLHHEVAPSNLPGKTYAYDVEVKETAFKSLEWHRISGDFKAVDGFWRLVPIDGGRFTEVTYSSYVNGGFFMPQMLIKSQFKVDMPKVLTHLKAESEMNTVRLARKTDSEVTQ
jgi:ribosome-associated toxin RatA of RatAB toxin-antitoxin module